MGAILGLWVRGRASTARGAAVLRFLRTFLGEHGLAPTCREIGAGLGHSGSWALEGLRDLEADLLIERTPRKARAIRLLAAVPPPAAGAVRARVAVATATKVAA